MWRTSNRRYLGLAPFLNFPPHPHIPLAFELDYHVELPATLQESLDSAALVSISAG